MKPILVVEDSRLFGRLFKKRFESEFGVPVHLATSYAEARALIDAENAEYSIGLLDLNLPDSTEGEAVDFAIAKGIPTVVFTGDYSEDAGVFHAHVLLVEDNPVNQTFATRMLEKLGCQIDVAPNGQEAVDRLAHGTYDLVFMDCQMPVMDGFEATRAIRQGEKAGRHVPIVAMTANAMKGDREACLDVGMDDYVAKPISIRDLREALWRHCSALHGDFQSSPRGQLERVSEGGGGSPLTAAESGVGLPVWDVEAALDRVERNVELLETMAEGFLECVGDEMAMLEDALASGDVALAEITAHSIKGMAANAGGAQVRDAAYQVEQSAKNKDPGTCARCLPALREAVARLAELLEHAQWDDLAGRAQTGLEQERDTVDGNR